MKEFFHKASTRVSNLAGAPGTFLLAVAVVIVWAFSGPMFGFSDTWQLIINTGTTIMTFLMVFLIQNTQNRDGKAVQLKLDELIRSTKGARDEFVGLETLTDEELDALDKEFDNLHTLRENSPVMRKLHRNIEKENQRRRERNLARKALQVSTAAMNMATQTAVNALKTPLGSQPVDPQKPVVDAKKPDQQVK